MLIGIPENLPTSHLVPLAGDTDGDYLTDAEETAIGYALDNPDEDGNGQLDGLDLARAVADKVTGLPMCYEYGKLAAKLSCKKALTPRPPLQPELKAEGIVTRCLEILEWDCMFFEPVLGLETSTEYYVSTNNGDYSFSAAMIQIMRIEGSFSYYSCGCTCQNYRLDVPFIYTLLNMGGETEPTPTSHLVPVAEDTDGDYLSDWEENSIGYDATEPDEDGNSVLDGLDLARAFASRVRALPLCDTQGEGEKLYFNCGKAARHAQLERIWAPPAVDADKDGEICATVDEADCLLYDPVLDIHVAWDEYRIRRDTMQYYIFSADALMLSIMDLEGSLCFYVQQNGEWVLRRIQVPTWYDYLMP